ncbi:MAG: hypothetical protein EOO43_12625, partial [Flavobacterium sp.]
MRHILLPVFLFLAMDTLAQMTPYELSSKKETATYNQAIEFYKELEDNYSKAKLLTFGQTDFGKPLHLFVLSNDGVFDPVLIRKNDRRVLLINNG